MSLTRYSIYVLPHCIVFRSPSVATPGALYPNLATAAGSAFGSSTTTSLTSSAGSSASGVSGDLQKQLDVALSDLSARLQLLADSGKPLDLTTLEAELNLWAAQTLGTSGIAGDTKAGDSGSVGSSDGLLGKLLQLLLPEASATGEGSSSSFLSGLGGLEGLTKGLTKSTSAGDGSSAALLLAAAAAMAGAASNATAAAAAGATTGSSSTSSGPTSPKTPVLKRSLGFKRRGVKPDGEPQSGFFDVDEWYATAAAAAAAAQEEYEQEANAAAATAAADGADGAGAGGGGIFPHSNDISSTSPLIAALAGALALAQADAAAGFEAQLGCSPLRLELQHLVLLPASEAVAQLLTLTPHQLLPRLLLLCGAGSVGVADATADAATDDGKAVARGDEIGYRGDKWLVGVVEGCSAKLGLVEMGVLLAAIHDRYV